MLKTRNILPKDASTVGEIKAKLSSANLLGTELRERILSRYAFNLDVSAENGKMSYAGIINDWNFAIFDVAQAVGATDKAFKAAVSELCADFDRITDCIFSGKEADAKKIKELWKKTSIKPRS